MKILVTGGAGFIGSNFIHYMLRSYPDIQITNLDKLTYAGNLDNLALIEKDSFLSSRYEFIKGDIADAVLIDRLMAEDFDAIINFAAESHVDRSIEDADIFLKTNVLGTQNLLEGLRKHKIKRFIQISTDEVYGSLGSEGKFTEDSPLMPNSPYSASKASADLICRAYFKTFHLPIIITRCSKVLISFLKSSFLFLSPMLLKTSHYLFTEMDSILGIGSMWKTIAGLLT
jgi:dTDP-glucose 4,6-dehydratase